MRIEGGVNSKASFQTLSERISSAAANCAMSLNCPETKRATNKPIRYAKGREIFIIVLVP